MQRLLQSSTASAEAAQTGGRNDAMTGYDKRIRISPTCPADRPRRALDEFCQFAVSERLAGRDCRDPGPDTALEWRAVGP